MSSNNVNKNENLSTKKLTLHFDLIVKRGELKQKQSILTHWKTKYFVFDGHCLYNVSKRRSSSSSPVNCDNSNNQMVNFNIMKKYTLMTQQQETQSDNVVTKVVDAQMLLGKDCCIGFFFKDCKTSPLFLMASDTKEHAEWLTVLQKAIEKNETSNTSVNSIHSAVEAMIDMAVITDAFGQIQCVNKALLTFFGYSRTDILNKNISTIMPRNFAKRHDNWMDNYRKSGQKRLIGIPRTLPVQLRNGSMTNVIVSIGEIPDSTNSDGDRFLGVMKPAVTTIIQPTDSQQEQPRTIAYRTLSSLHSEVSSLNNKMHDKLKQVEQELVDEISESFVPIFNQSKIIQNKIESLEKRNQDLIMLTSNQNMTIDILQKKIDAIYTEDSECLQTLIPDSNSTIIKHHQEESMKFDQVLNDRAALRYFMLYASTEQSTDSFKFYLYIMNHYKTETNFNKLVVKRDFVMETFVRNGSQHELNLSSQQRLQTIERYKQIQQQQIQQQQQQFSEQTDCNSPISLEKEQSFFDGILQSVKIVMFDTFSRFRNHKLFQEMQQAVYMEDLMAKHIRVMSF
jgi:PAS domain S-box-containing protein